MAPTILEKQIEWIGKYLQSVIIRLRTSSGRIVTWEAFQRVNCRGIVAVVPFTSDGFVILTKQYRPPVDKYVIEFPAGLNDRDEPLERVAMRELFEETGYHADSVQFLCEGPLSSGASSEILTVFVARDVVDTGTQHLDGIEEIKVIKLPVDGFYRTLRALQDPDTFFDLKTPGLFEMAYNYL